MQFIYNFDQQKDTIAAIATPAGEGAIAIIRLAGKNALSIFDKIFSKNVKKMPSHTVHFGKIIDPDNKNKIIDTALAFIMKAPKSYTGEDLIEINCHGGSLITRQVLNAVLKAGARPALPGEFTLRAFLNHKIDLAQAEAVQTLICAQNNKALAAAKDQLEGRLSQEIKTLQKELIETAALLEAGLDFPEEKLELEALKNLKPRLTSALSKMQKLFASFDLGKKLIEGMKIAIIGTPNVGKSSLMNLLCQKEKAIVTDIPGTTRDLIEETSSFGSFHFHLIDTAGIRKASSKIEKEGIKRSEKIFKEADLVLLVLDSSRPLNADDQKLIKIAKAKKTILIWNKTDLQPSPQKLNFPYEILISAKQKTGLSLLIDTMQKTLENTQLDSKEQIILTQERHKASLKTAIENCQKAVLGIENNISEEFIAADLRFALLSLGQIIGHDLSEDILSEIFSKFCIGK